MIIQKFGGTSVATSKSRKAVLHKVSNAIQEGEQPIVVVSAMGRIGEPYATDTLLQFVEKNAGEMTSREHDLLLSCGEIISAVTMATLLNENGIKARAFTGGQAGIITDNNFAQAELLYTEPKLLLQCVEEGVVPVVAGFQGVTIDGQITTIGRGGSDTTAAMVGSSIRASRIEIYTDVDGIMTADPRICEKAHIIDNISYNEIFQMADSGAKVIHPRAVEFAMRANIPLVIKNTFTDAPGTYIAQDVADPNYQSPNPHKIITGIAHKNNRVQYTIEEPIMGEIDLLYEIAMESISMDMVNIFRMMKVFTIDANDQEKLEKLLTKFGYEFSKVTGCAKLTSIGQRMTGIPGIMAKIIRCLTKENINVMQTADSLTTIACLIPEDDLTKAICSLHQEFGI